VAVELPHRSRLPVLGEGRELVRQIDAVHPGSFPEGIGI
jgi:hypothetical protein